VIAGVEEEEDVEAQPEKLPAWPKKVPEQLAAVRDLVTRSSGAWTAQQVAKSFRGGVGKAVEAMLESLVGLGLVAYEGEKGEGRDVSRGGEGGGVIGVLTRVRDERRRVHGSSRGPRRTALLSLLAQPRG
jgi:hypothetical protein